MFNQHSTVQLWRVRKRRNLGKNLETLEKTKKIKSNMPSKEYHVN